MPLLNAENPFAPPKADVADVGTHLAAPPLWNPNAAAAWSLFLSPLFGAFIHMKNWEAMGEARKAATSRTWAGASLAFLVLAVLSVTLPDSGKLDLVFQGGGLVLLIAWYYGSGKAQNAFVLARYGHDYPRKGWARPLLLALAAMAAFTVLAVIVVLALGLPDEPSP